MVTVIFVYAKVVYGQTQGWFAWWEVHRKEVVRG